MRAWQLHDTNGPDSITLDEIEDPEPGPGEVRVAPKVMALNRLDLWVSRGLPAPHAFPHVPGADAAGIVDAVGAGVTTVAPGDEVVVNPSLSCGECPACLGGDIVFCPRFAILGEHRSGTLAERFVVPSRNVVPKPAAMDWRVAGSFGLATGTAHRMLRRARLGPGETLLVVGVGGGVSSAAMVLGRVFGARVFVTSTSEEKIDWAVDHGAVGGFDSNAEFSKGIKAAAGGASVVVENVGPATWDQSVRSTRPGGRIVVCGSTSGTKVELTMPVLFFKQLEIIGSSMFTHAEFADTLAMAAWDGAHPPVDRVFGFEELPAALAMLDEARQLGKLAISLED